MDLSVSKCCMAATPPDKTLKRQLSTLSKVMSSSLVGKISTCLCQSHILTEYDVQLIHSSATDTLKASQLLLTLLRKGPSACQLFFKCLAVCNPSLFKTTTGCTVNTADLDHFHSEDMSCSETTGAVSPYIINIHNSSLNNCIIGNNNGLCSRLSQSDITNVEKVEDMQRPDQQVAAEDSAETSYIQVKSSNVEFVIIGDNNYMSIGNSQDSEEQEEQESELEDSEG
ncbi:uncharacterized protein [Salminus brasiliensis]|uniref:uncharacterized protein n=1 Tax=Salminus brasiliensis TaxID=930266 RepID=UPI003B832879